MFRLFTARINAMFENYIILWLVLQKNVSSFLQRALRQCLIITLSYIREQMFRLFTARIKAIFDHNDII